MSEHSICVCVDEEDGDLLRIKIGPSSGYARTTTRPQKYIHCIIAERMGLSWDKKHQVIDHINRNKLDNRRSNLRVVSRSENALNSNRSDFAGGYWYRKGRWFVQLVRNGTRYRKSFKTKLEAEKYVEIIKNEHK